MELFADFLGTLKKFEPITLAEMDSVSLLDRTDVKFIFHKSKLNEILVLAKENYRSLEVNGMRYADYDTNYFDTDNFKFYNDHHNQRTNRYKVRMRSYVNSDLHFFEIKYKSNRNRTVKSRVKIPFQESLIKGKAAELLENVIGMPPETLKKAIQINCKRITLVNKGLSERVTIDFDIKYSINNKLHSFCDMVIVEIKQDKASKSLFLDIMRNNHIRSQSLSKYSFGVANFIPKVKNNNFKSQILYVNKICKNQII